MDSLYLNDGCVGFSYFIKMIVKMLNININFIDREYLSELGHFFIFLISLSKVTNPLAGS